MVLEAMSIIVAIGPEDGRLCFVLSQKYFDQIYCWFRSSFKNLLTKNDRSLAKTPNLSIELRPFRGLSSF
ncbi:hypothetical protein [Campylobacter concisus]|uniref:hypothetical protein n=1 Tax=Campylobacter concisus TaxID=199 RepID=UPI00122C4704|nr:hypothetical protein [Campylobacter concisus]